MRKTLLTLLPVALLALSAPQSASAMPIDSGIGNAVSSGVEPATYYGYYGGYGYRGYGYGYYPRRSYGYYNYGYAPRRYYAPYYGYGYNYGYAPRRYYGYGYRRW